VAVCRQRSDVATGEGYVEDVGKSPRRQQLAALGRSDEKDIAALFGTLSLILLRQPLDVPVDRLREGSVGVLLAGEKRL